MDVFAMDIAALSRALRERKISAVELTRAYIGRIDARDGETGAYLATTFEMALAQAVRADARLAAGEDASPLTGIPMALKDNMATRGVATTCASKMLEGYVPPYSATVAERLEAAGCVLLGKANMDEFAMGSTTENSAFRITRNPRDPSRVPGGSSGGSAAAVAAGEAVFALGSDTGGSIRQPASFCGVVGLKPTYGAVSRYGLIAFASSLDQIGPLTRTVRDCALVMNCIAGRDARDATSSPRGGGDYLEGLEGGVKGMRVAMPRELMGEGVDGGVRKSIQGAAARLERLGAQIEEVSMPALKHALAAYYVLSSAEASSNLARFDGVGYGRRAEKYEDLYELYARSRSEGFGAEVKRRIMLGAFALSEHYADAYYGKALRVRTLVARDYARVFESADVILSPVAPTVAGKLGARDEDPVKTYLGDVCTVPASIAGLPAISVNCGEGEGGMPVGAQLTAPAFAERTLLRAAYALEQGV